MSPHELEYPDWWIHQGSATEKTVREIARAVEAIRDAGISSNTPDPSEPAVVFEQSAPSSAWQIVHNLGRFPEVDVLDVNNVSVWAYVHHIDNNTIEVLFSQPEAGKVILR